MSQRKMYMALKKCVKENVFTLRWALSNWITFGNSHVGAIRKLSSRNKSKGKCLNWTFENPCANVWKRSFPPTICTRDALYLIDCQNWATGARCRPKANDTKEELVVRGDRNKKRSEVKRGGERMETRVVRSTLKVDLIIIDHSLLMLLYLFLQGLA